MRFNYIQTFRDRKPFWAEQQKNIWDALSLNIIPSRTLLFYSRIESASLPSNICRVI